MTGTKARQPKPPEQPESQEVTELLLDSKGVDWWAAIQGTPGMCWRADFKVVNEDSFFVTPDHENAVGPDDLRKWN